VYDDFTSGEVSELCAADQRVSRSAKSIAQRKLLVEATPFQAISNAVP
jgi:hypothetical protein